MSGCWHVSDSLHFSFIIFHTRLDYQLLLEKMRQELSHKFADQNKVVKMADDVDKMNLAFERVLECFKLQNLKDSQREALQNLVKGQDVFVIQPTGSGKSLIFQSAPIVFDTVRPLTNAKSIALVISPLASLMQDQVRYLKSVGIKVEFIAGLPRAKRAWDRAPYSWNMVNLFSFGCHVIDRAYASTDCTGGVGETIKRKGGVSQACLGKSTSLI